VYIPLGGNRHGLVRAFAALLVTFALTSLWHGATWPFLLWGGMWSLALIIERATGLRNVTAVPWLRRAVMAVFIVVTWVPFRSPDMDTTLNIWRAMATGPWALPDPAVLVVMTPLALAALAVGLATFFLPDRGAPRVFDRLVLTSGDPEAIRIPMAIIVGSVTLVVGVIMVLWGSFSPFLYFQF